jgi:two-component system response regulator PilR (NtrC family)
MAQIYNILVVDDEESIREFLEIFLSSEGYIVSTTPDPLNTLEIIKKGNIDICISDIKMPGMNGVELLREIKKIKPEMPVIMITAFASMDTAIDAMKEGALDYISKPFDDLNSLRKVMHKAIECCSKENNKSENREACLIEETVFFDNIVAKSPPMIKILRLLPQIANSPSNVLITGESGTGKELIARALYKSGNRAQKNFVAINCGGIPETLLESELFGYKKGAFTGADRDKQGLFASANHGVIFLDEIGEMSLTLQVKLLRVLQEKAILPIGDSEEIKIDVRIISATNKNLEEEIINKNFREDLYYRLNVINLHIPSLRERKEDIPILIRHFLYKYSKEHGRDWTDISEYSLKLLLDYTFPGNIRELENIIERGVALSSSNIILPESLHLAKHKIKIKTDEEKELRPDAVNLPDEGLDLEKLLNDIEKKFLILAMQRTKNSKKDAANLLMLDMRSLRYRLDKYGIS